jgi:hypothetical protein
LTWGLGANHVRGATKVELRCPVSTKLSRIEQSEYGRRLLTCGMTGLVRQKAPWDNSSETATRNCPGFAWLLTCEDSLLAARMFTWPGLSPPGSAVTWSRLPGSAKPRSRRSPRLREFRSNPAQLAKESRHRGRRPSRRDGEGSGRWPTA